MTTHDPARYAETVAWFQREIDRLRDENQRLMQCVVETQTALRAAQSDGSSESDRS